MEDRTSVGMLACMTRSWLKNPSSAPESTRKDKEMVP